MASFTTRIKTAWNAFSNQNENDRDVNSFASLGPTVMGSFGSRPDRVRMRFGTERSIISSIYTRISIDAAAVDIRHVQKDELGRYKEDMSSDLNECLSLEANLDQGARAFRQDMVMSLLDKGVIAIVPIDTSEDPEVSPTYDVQSMRVGEILNWYPDKVRVNVYRDETGKREPVTLYKKNVAIIENPLHAVMNEPNSTLQRLIRKLGLLDTIDEKASSNKLDLIIQLPYVIKSDARRQQAEQRRQDIEFQLQGSQFGIAYTDGTEKITQLNRPIENTLLPQVEYLTKMLYSQLGITEGVMDGTADEKAMLNYMNRTVRPILEAITEGMRRTFLTKVARDKGETIAYFSDPFKLVPLANLAEIADKFTRNEIMTSNEIRAVVGLKPSIEPKADKLQNSNMPVPAGPDNPTSPS